MGSKTTPYTETPLKGYVVADEDLDADPQYFGYLAADGRWYIVRRKVETWGYSNKYIKGDDGYEANWTGRAGLTFSYFNYVF